MAPLEMAVLTLSGHSGRCRLEVFQSMGTKFMEEGMVPRGVESQL